jgi:exonuclease SbcD
MRFIHTADWHLGRLFHGVHLTEDQAILLDQIYEILKDYKAHCLIIAGDIFDRAAPPVEAIRLLNDFLTRVHLDLNTTIVAIAGNHDSPDRLGFGAEILGRSGAHLRGNLRIPISPAIVNDEFGECAIYPIPYADPAVVRERFNSPDIDDHHTAMERIINTALASLDRKPRSIAVAHAYINSGARSESERPLAIGAVEGTDAGLFKGFSYTALGHLHRPQSAGSENIRYSGAIYKYSFEESNHKKSVLAVEMDERGRVKPEEIHLNPKRDVRVIRGFFKELIDSHKDYGPCEDYLMVSLKDTGPIVDGMHRLREVFPNALRMQREGDGETEGGVIQWASMRRSRDETEWFRAFFRHVTGNEPHAPELEVFTTILDQLRQTNGEDAP